MVLVGRKPLWWADLFAASGCQGTAIPLNPLSLPRHRILVSTRREDEVRLMSQCPPQKPLFYPGSFMPPFQPKVHIQNEIIHFINKIRGNTCSPHLMGDTMVSNTQDPRPLQTHK